MAKPAQRSYSRYAREAAELLGLMIHEARISRKLTIAEIAERAGVSRGLVHRVEKGAMGCSLGAVFEIAAIVGVQLFDLEPTALTRNVGSARDKNSLLPKAIRTTAKKVDDDF